MFFASWFPTFLQKTRGVSVEKSGYLQGVVLGGSLLGGIFGGLLTDWISRRTGSLRVSRSGVGAASLGICSIAMLGAWFVESTEVAVFLLAAGALFVLRVRDLALLLPRSISVGHACLRSRE